MNPSLFALLQALTLLDLGFVQATGAVDGPILAAMWSLALASPWLRSLQRYRVHRLAWNGGVLLAFAFLVHHATTSGLLHMLEDGLVLAVLCQVHLLNNVGAGQPPDLLFFNSFLIAFVTGFFAPDASWAGLFVAHAFALVPALQLQATLLAGGADRRAAWRVAADGAPRAACVLAVTFAAFVALPRDFARQGWLGEVALPHRDYGSTSGERIRLDDVPAPARGERIVARIRPLDDTARADAPTHWRTKTFHRFDGRQWIAREASPLGPRAASDPVWEQHADGSLRRRLPDGPRATLLVQLADDLGARLPVPLAATLVAATASTGQLDGIGDGCIRMLPDGGAAPSELEFAVQVAIESGSVRVADAQRAALTELPPTAVPDLAHELVARLRATRPTAADARALASAAAAWLADHRRYALPGSPGFARDFSAFLRGDGAGHCEYFATALALLLRLQGVPCRLVGGWLVHEWDAAANALLVRARHAHAWVEALDEQGRWHTFDATPPDAASAAGTADGWWSQLGNDIARWWATALAFDAGAQARWLAACAALLWPPVLPGIAAVLAALLFWRRHRRNSPPVVRALHRALQAAGVALRPGETPRAAVRRAAVAGVDRARLAALRRAAERHERHRYQLIQ